MTSALLVEELCEICQQREGTHLANGYATGDAQFAEIWCCDRCDYIAFSEVALSGVRDSSPVMRNGGGL